MRAGEAAELHAIPAAMAQRAAMAAGTCCSLLFHPPGTSHPDGLPTRGDRTLHPGSFWWSVRVCTCRQARPGAWSRGDSASMRNYDRLPGEKRLACLATVLERSDGMSRDALWKAHKTRPTPYRTCVCRQIKIVADGRFVLLICQNIQGGIHGICGPQWRCTRGRHESMGALKRGPCCLVGASDGAQIARSTHP